jgi:hypothetical protein
VIGQWIEHEAVGARDQRTQRVCEGVVLVPRPFDPEDVVEEQRLAVAGRQAP